MKKSAKGKPLARKTVKRKSAVARKARSQTIRQKATRAWWVLRGVAAGLVIVVLAVGGWYLSGMVVRHPSLSVKQIVVDGCRDIPPERIVDLSGVPRGAPLLRVDLRAVRKKVISHPRVVDAVVIRQLPDTVKIEVVERRPTAVTIGSGFFLLDREGIVLAALDSYPEGYPLITGIRGAWNPGERVTDALPGLSILDELVASGLMGPDRISEIRVADTGRAFVSLVGTGTVLVMDPVDPGPGMDRLARLIESNNFDARAAGYDLRFEGRVILLPGRDGTINGRAKVPSREG